ncbi:MAG TPA: Nif11-like leader peptide family natural product precursor [Chlorobaculum parvum]|uniref:Nif11-like leader peptide family natural product n=1 Tax=Chlorobaculum parvum TaxID=274539 RepID=A0A7C5DDZ8_9CHLB|nr:Nif11-like leader peptide family natural product precursor [Chlorobaculum parvum]
MSLSSARAFLDKIMADDELRRQLVDDLLKSRMELIKKAGFEFTEEELDHAKSNMPPGALGHEGGWFCQVLLDERTKRGGYCGGGVWH